MAYSSFKTLKEIEVAFGVKNQRVSLFRDVVPCEMSEDLKKAILLAQELPIKSEKARSELIVTPILLEVRNLNHKVFTIYSGDNLNVDETRGLNGECDFIIAKDTGSFEVSYPIIQLVEAKKNDVEIGLPQCAAQMIGAKIWNDKNNASLSVMYGCVTTGDDWLFLKLTDDMLFIDVKKYYLDNHQQPIALCTKHP